MLGLVRVAERRCTAPPALEDGGNQPCADLPYRLFPPATRGSAAQPLDADAGGNRSRLLWLLSRLAERQCQASRSNGEEGEDEHADAHE